MDTYLFFGQMVEHPKYGTQFSVTSYERCKPEEKDAIVDFFQLSHGSAHLGGLFHALHSFLSAW